MMTRAGGYLFLLGLACGLAILPLTAYARLTPRWVRWLLLAAGALVVGRYVALAGFSVADTLSPSWWLRRLWFGGRVGLMLPAVFAVDALIRHPAMTPKKLLLRFSPFLAAYAALIVAGPSHPIANQIAPIIQGLFVIGFVGLCLLLARKLPVPAIRTALWILAAAYVYLGVDGVGAEMAASLALWYAFQTAARLQA